MIVSTAWIKEYTDLPNLPPKELAEHITLCVCEVEQVLPDPWEANELLLDIDNKSLTHRPDLWGHYGMAREFAAVFQCPLKPFYSGHLQNQKSFGPVSVRIEPDSCCLGFEGLSMDGIKIRQSPDWMRHRLAACGLRALNNITDISNYVMLETGMPLHIFDRAKIRGGRIIVKPGENSCSLTTLDGTERSLDVEDTLIFDQVGPISIAGVMGGLESAVTSGTTHPEHFPLAFGPSRSWIQAMYPVGRILARMLKMLFLLHVRPVPKSEGKVKSIQAAESLSFP